MSVHTGSPQELTRRNKTSIVAYPKSRPDNPHHVIQNPHQRQPRLQEVSEYREQRPPHARWGGYALQVELEGRASVAQA